VQFTVSDGPGITETRLTTPEGDIVVSRADGVTAVLSRPGAPDSRVALPRRDLAELLAEELRRLDPDEVYGEVISHLEPM
jgi:glucose-6-phosphate dehydrogenase assembly protein OpcA